MDLETGERAETAAPASGSTPGAARASGRRRGGGGLTGRRAGVGLAVVLGAGVLALAWHVNLPPRHAAFDAIPGTLRVLVAAAVVFGLTGLGLTRLLLPAALRRYEALWILPAGGCATGLALTVLGFAGVPYPASLAVVLGAGLALSVRALRTRGRPELSAGHLAWPAYLAALVLGVTLVPMLFHLHYLAPIGTGSDAHVAAGAANFLKHAYPTGTDLSQPVQQMPPTWKSKFPIYYASAAVSTVSGLATWQTLAPMAGILIALAALGLFLLAREVFRARTPVALAAMGLAGVDRMALFTALNPYFNQTWGYFAMPFTVVLGWQSVQPELSRSERARTVALLAVFGLILLLAYPLAAPIPAVPLVVFALSEHRRRVRAGEPVFRLRSVYHGRRSLLWIVPLAALLAFPLIGAAQKAVSAAQVLAPGHSLQGWAGDLRSFIPFAHFVSMPNSVLGTAGAALVLALAAWGLVGRPRALSLGLGGLLAIGLLLSLYLRHRAYGYYFEFKLLAFIGPLLVLIAALGAARLRRLALPLLGILAVATGAAVLAEIDFTGYQLDRPTIALRDWAAGLPRAASVRLDMWPPQQLWAAYFLAARPECSQLPLLGTDYPHVARSRKADYIVASIAYGRPVDAAGAPLRQNEDYRLYRESPSVPGPSRCVRRRFDRIYSGAGHSAS